MNKKKSKLANRTKRKRRIRGRISGTAKKPRLSVFRSNKHLYIQAVDDDKEVTIAAYSDFNLDTKSKKVKKALVAGLVGVKLGEKLKQLKIKEAVFDRSGYSYLGRIKALADGVRSAGINF